MNKENGIINMGFISQDFQFNYNLYVSEINGSSSTMPGALNAPSHNQPLTQNVSIPSGFSIFNYNIYRTKKRCAQAKYNNLMFML